jgi:hypothetical protein
MKINITAIMWELKTGIVKSKPSVYTVLYKSGIIREYSVTNFSELPLPVQKYINCALALDSYKLAKVEKITPYTMKVSVVFSTNEVLI